MGTLETLLSRRWILKSREKELYYQVKDEIPKVRKFLTEKLGYQVIVNPYMVKVEKIPAKAESWMGIQEFTDQLQYVFLCLILMFLEDKDVQGQFVLSEVTEYIQMHYKEEQIDWTMYHYRRHLIRVMKYCVKCGILQVNDGSEENFMRSDSGEVLYENTGASRYFMKNFTFDIMSCTSPEDFETGEWFGMDEDRGVIRRQRVYRELLMKPAIVRTAENEEDFAYLRNYRNMIQGELDELFNCELQIYRDAAFLIMENGCALGRSVPEENSLSDIVLLCCGLIHEKICCGEIRLPEQGSPMIAAQQFRLILEECKQRFGRGMIKSYREMTDGEFCRELWSYMELMGYVESRGDGVVIRPLAGKVIGVFPEDFETGGRKNEQ